MSLVFAAITPHPPLLIPAIGKDLIKKIDKTKRALEKLEEELYLSKPEIICIISPHGRLYADAFSLNLAKHFETNLTEFGDLTTKLRFKNAAVLAARVQRGSHQYKSCPVVTMTEKFLDHGSAVPLFYLTAHLPNIAILPIGFCDLDWKTHLEFGGLLKKMVIRTNKRVAIIASGDLSHALQTDAPAGFNAAGPEFDAKIQELLATRNTTGLLNLDPSLIHAAAECGFRSFLILMGLLRDTHYTYESLSYEAPFGVGYLTANFAL